MAKPTAIELFCGIGGMTYGFDRAGFNVVGAFDWDRTNVDYHTINFPNSKTFQKDVGSLHAREILKLCGIRANSLDVLFGGPPCQGFSEIGRKELGDQRNLLILDFARLVGELCPKYFVVENVRGLLYNYSKAILDKFLLEVRSYGYEVVEPIRLLDASHHGVPQKRQRAFILGYRKGLTAPEYPPPLMNGDELRPAPTVAEAIGDLPEVTDFDELLANDVYHGTLGTSSDYATRLRKDHPACPAEQRSGGLSGCLRTIHSETSKRRFLDTVPGKSEPISRCYRLKLDGVAYTLRAGSDVNNGSFTAARPIHPRTPRCITTREAARLHSFPDWFEFHPTKWHGFRQVGNAVPPLFAEAVAKQIVAVLSKPAKTPASKRRFQPVIA